MRKILNWFRGIFVSNDNVKSEQTGVANKLNVFYYENLFRTMTVIESKKQEINDVVIKILNNKERYLKVEELTKVPWYVVAVIHFRECGLDFSLGIHCGQRWDRATTLVPKGRGPFQNWEESCVDALRLDHFSSNLDWPLGQTLQLLERFNGLGFFYHGCNSAYLWSYTTHYRQGGFPADGRWSDSYVSKQCGVAPLLKVLISGGF